jgi:hypothetical protein
MSFPTGGALAMVADTTSNDPLKECWITTDPKDLNSRFDREHFEITHSLTEHPLLQIPSLMKLAERTMQNRPEGIYYDAGKDIRIDQRWDQMPKKQFSAVESIERIETCGAWMLFKDVQKDSEYKDFLGSGWEKIKTNCGTNLNSQILREDALIFVTSPKRIATYHIDRECSFLLQIKGTKTIHIFDRADREVLPEEEIERFWTVDNNAPVYKPQFQGRATSYKLRAGNGVHIPVNCPHWVENDDNVSVSLNVNVQFKDTRRANMYRANYALRTLGLTPRPPGQSPAVDYLKSHSMVPVLAAKSALHKLSSLRKTS